MILDGFGAHGTFIEGLKGEVALKMDPTKLLDFGRSKSKIVEE